MPLRVSRSKERRGTYKIKQNTTIHEQHRQLREEKWVRERMVRGKATEVHKQVTDGAEYLGRRQILVMVVISGVND